MHTQLGLYVILSIVILFLLCILYAWHRDSSNKIDLKDLICIDHRLDEKKFVRFGAWIVSTWGFVFLIIENRFSEWYFMGYMAAWVGNAIADMYLSRRHEEVRFKMYERDGRPRESLNLMPGQSPKLHE